ncbi:VOC family protein [Gordonia paraffinivorans]|uniref:VOC family protein n=1 Tax=Gordonia paraffinivorans TaxID=175628 RepID=UPI0014468C15|nr:VOC family protein [Gordonia paraffinivorans]
MIPPISSSRPVPTVLVELACPNTADTARAHAALLGLPDGSSSGGDSFSVVIGNTELRLRESAGADTEGDAAFDAEGDAAFDTEGDAAFDAEHRVYFTVDDLAAARRLLIRRGFPVSDGQSDPGPVGEMTPLGIAEASGSEPIPVGDITGMDHLVFAGDDRDRAVALFGGVFGLDFRLDQPIGDAARQLFFRADDLIVEVVTGIRAADTPAPSAAASLWGVAWRAPDIEVTHARLSDVGLDVSEIRAGRKKGTRIFTVRERALGTRTVVIGPA